MRFSELLDRIAHPAGTMVKRAFAWEGLGDCDEIVERSPREFLEKLTELLNGDDRQAKLFIYLAAEALRVERGVDIDPDEWLEAFLSDDAAYVRLWLRRLEGELT